MKKFSFLKVTLWGTVVTVVALSSCSDCSEKMVNPSEAPLVPVTIQVPDFTMSMEKLPSGFSDASTRAESASSYETLKVLTLAFYQGTTKVFESTQTRTDASTYETFGQFSCTLPSGTYTLVAIGRELKEDDVFTLTSPTSAGYTSDKVRETFCASQSVTVASSPVSLSVTLNRVVAMIRVQSTDPRPADATRIRMTFSEGGKSFNPTTGLATVNTGFSALNTPTSTAVGEAIKINNMLFLATDEQTMDVTLEVLDDDNHVLVTKTIPDVPMKRNRKTTLTGAVFTSPVTSTFLVESAWLTDLTVPF